VASNLDPEHTEACFRAVECDTFDQPGKGFAILGGDVGGHAIHDASSPVIISAISWIVFLRKVIMVEYIAIDAFLCDRTLFRDDPME
jgi:hypothetical protein